jgi:hypothetical protein
LNWSVRCPACGKVVGRMASGQFVFQKAEMILRPNPPMSMRCSCGRELLVTREGQAIYCEKTDANNDGENNGQAERPDGAR